MFRNKIPETRRPDCLCNGMKTPDHEQKLHLAGTAKPGVQKTLDCHSESRRGGGITRFIYICRAERGDANRTYKTIARSLNETDRARAKSVDVTYTV
jgi:hypothetical protein